MKVRSNDIERRHGLRGRQFAWRLGLCALLASPSAQADIGPDFGFAMLALMGWPAAVMLFFALAAPGHRLAWALGVTAGYPLLYTALLGFITRLEGAPFSAAAPALLAQAACVVLLAAWMLLLRIRASRRDASPLPASPWVACAASLLSLLALACMAAPQFAHPLVEIGGWGTRGGSRAATFVVGAHLVAAWMLWRRRRWALPVSAAVAALGLVIMLAALNDRANSFLAALWCGTAAAALLALALAWRHGGVDEQAAASPRFRAFDALWLLAIVLVAPMGSPQFAANVFHNARVLSGALELRRDRNERAAAVTRMQAEAKAEAARKVADWKTRARANFGPLQAGDLDTLPIAADASTCDVRIWAAGVGETWDTPRIALRARLERNASGRWEAEVGVAARDLALTRLRYGGMERLGQSLARIDPNRTKLTRAVYLYNDGVERGGYRIRRLEIWPLLGAKDEWTEEVENRGPDPYHLPTWQIPYLHVFAFEQVWPQADLDTLARDPRIRFQIAVESPVFRHDRWGANLYLLASGAMKTQLRGDYETVVLLDPSIADRLRAVFGVDANGRTVMSALFEPLGDGRVTVEVNDPYIEAAAAKIHQVKRPITYLALRVDPGKVTEHDGRLERAIVAPAGLPDARAGLQCGPSVPSWFVDSFRVATGEGFELSGPVQ